MLPDHEKIDLRDLVNIFSVSMWEHVFLFLDYFSTRCYCELRYVESWYDYRLSIYKSIHVVSWYIFRFSTFNNI